jgi:hypothetical protein
MFFAKLCSLPLTRGTAPSLTVRVWRSRKQQGWPRECCRFESSAHPAYSRLPKMLTVRVEPTIHGPSSSKNVAILVSGKTRSHETSGLQALADVLVCTVSTLTH